ncbi:MAG: response regulator transcription factor [Xanthomonadales bacterium]|nr:response regulator [Gammaproteobacteria bacterium]NNE04508.1 response regulator transcription factor [Xanthomonadales bacterium]NNL96488.1 response regulator transcription factor [Xanthomonadales bacterium]
MVCIIDDDEAVRESLRILLFSAGFDTCSFESADDWLESEDKPSTDVFLLDIRMPGTDGTELHRIMLEQGSRVPVIFITGHGDIPLAVAAIQRGATDFLTKPFEDGELIERIGSAIEQFRQEQQRDRELADLRRRFESLTPRERDVLELIVDGKSNKGVATALSISPRTVEIHRARVMEKIAAESVAELVRMAENIRMSSS